MSPIALALLASFCFAASTVTATKGLHLFPTPWGVWITLATNTLVLVALHFYVNPQGAIFVTANLPFVLIGLFVPGVTRILSFRGFLKLGSSVTSTVINSTPLFSALLAITVLEERPGLLALSGIGFVVSGLMSLSLGSKKNEKKTWSRVEILFPLSAALLFGLKDNLARWGLAASHPSLAAAISISVSTVQVFFIVRYLQRERFSMPPLNAFLWFTVSGIFTSGSYFLAYLALSMERVTIVSPIVNTYSAFVLLIAPPILGEAEDITRRKIASSLGVVAGVFLISIGRS